MGKIEDFYGKFNEDKRLTTRHGQVEYRVTMKYIHDMLDELRTCKQSNTACNSEKAVLENSDLSGSTVLSSAIKILDIGAGTGRYSAALCAEGYDVTAVELVKYNLGILKKKDSRIKAIQGNALNLKKLSDNTFDLTLLFGPMYHLMTDEEKIKALSEAKRVTRPGGIIMVAYIMNEYGFVMRGIQENALLESYDQGLLSDDFHILSNEDSIYDFVRIEDINRFNEDTGLKRIKIISPDGPVNYIRPFVNKLSDEAFEKVVEYQLATCERQDIIGAGAHTVDILRKK